MTTAVENATAPVKGIARENRLPRCYKLRPNTVTLLDAASAITGLSRTAILESALCAALAPVFAEALTSP